MNIKTTFTKHTPPFIEIQFLLLLNDEKFWQSWLQNSLDYKNSATDVFLFGTIINIGTQNKCYSSYFDILIARLIAKIHINVCVYPP